VAVSRHADEQSKETCVIRTTTERLLRALHLALALLIAAEGTVNLVHGFSPQRDPQLIAFGTAETVGALLLPWTPTLAMGVCVLACTFVIAAAVHLLAHDFPSEHLVYAVAVLSVMAHHRGQMTSDQPAAG
jgi:hypothetical protein